MLNTIKIRYDKFRNTEYITFKNSENAYNFGYTLLDFLSADVKNRYYEIIKDSNKNNHSEIFEKVSNLFNQDDTLLCNLFFGDDYTRFIQESNLSTYSGKFKRFDAKAKSYIEFENEKPFNSERDKKIRKLLDIIEKKQIIYTKILEFCSIDTPNDSKIYNRYLNKFIYAGKTLLNNFTQPKFTYDRQRQDISISDDTINELNIGYANSKPSPYADTNPIDELYYVCSDIDEFFTTFMFRLLERQYIISECKCCHKLFVPYKNNTALYCDRQSPQNPNKTCKEYEGAKPKGLNKLYRKIYTKKMVRVTRHKDDPTVKYDFDTWLEKAKKVKAKYDSNKISEDEYEKWLIENDK